MIYQSEPVFNVLTCSEMVGFGFSSSTICLSFDSSIFSFSSCFIEINFSLTSYNQFWSISFSSLGSLSLLRGIFVFLSDGSHFPFCSPWTCLHECLAIYFRLASAYFDQLCVDLPFPLVEKISDPLSQISNYSPIQAWSESPLLPLLLFCPEILGGRMEDLGFMFTFLLYLLAC